ncbi:MAG: DinB family protein [Candidatus Kariarchaeaceae archaeon]
MGQKEFLIQMFQYNRWANSRYRENLKEIKLDNLNLETKYGNLLDRIVHIFASYEMWHKRMLNESPTEVINASDFNKWSDLEKKWVELDNLLLKYVSQSLEEDLTQTVTYTSLDGRNFTRRRIDILFHLIQHPTYHRGQLSSYFKHSSLPDFPPTDVVVFLTAPDRGEN